MRPLPRRPTRATALWGGAALSALAAASLIAADLAALHRRARSAGPEVAAVVAARDLPLGTTVEPAHLAVVRRHSSHLPPRALPSAGAAVGRVVSTPVLRGTVVTDRHLAPRDRRGLDAVVPPGMRAVRVVVEGGVEARAGSVVDVLVTFDPSVVGGDTEPTLTVVRGALVIASDVDADDGWAEGAGVGVTVLTDPDGARRLAFASTQGVLTLALAPPEEAAPVPDP